MENLLLIVVVVVILVLLGLLVSNYTYFFDKGKLGEHAASARLTALPDDYRILNDLLLRTNYGTTQIDHVVVSKYGIFVIETKNYKGNIYGSKNAERWVQYTRHNQYSMLNPIAQNDLHVKTVKSYLTRLNINAEVYSIIAFTRRAKIKVNQKVCDIVYIDELLSKILSYNSIQITQEEVEHIYIKLQNENIVSPLERQEHVARIKTKHC